MARHLPDRRFDFAAVHLIGDKAIEADLRIDFTFTDLNETWTAWVRRGVLNARSGASPDAARAGRPPSARAPPQVSLSRPARSSLTVTGPYWPPSPG